MVILSRVQKERNPKVAKMDSTKEMQIQYIPFSPATTTSRELH